MKPRCLLSASLLAVTSALTTLAHAQEIVVVPPDAACPSADMIRAALPASQADGTWSGQRVSVEVAGNRLFLSMGEAQPARREIPADPDCSVRAASVAVVIAAWSGDLASRPTDSPVLPQSVDSPQPPGLGASPAPARPTDAPPSSDRKDLPVPTVTGLPPVPTPPSRSSHVVELDGAGFYSLLWGHAPGAWLGVGRTPRSGGLGVRALLAYQSARDLALEGGTNQFFRLLVGAAVTYHLQRSVVFSSGDLGLVGSLTRAQGTGYATNASASTANLGGVADLRAGLRLGRVRLWLGARVVRLLHEENVKIQSSSPGVADSATLAAWDVQLGAGLGVRFE